MSPRTCRLLGAWALVAAVGCVAEPETACEEAHRRFRECGVTVPLLEVEDCSAAPEAIAECILELAPGCNDLATWFERLGDCAAGFGVELGPLNPDLE